MKERPRTRAYSQLDAGDPVKAHEGLCGPEGTFRAVLDLVEPAMRRLGRIAARRWGVEVEDATQEARIAALERHRRGLPAELVVRYTTEQMLSPTRSPLAQTTRSRTAEGVVSSAGSKNRLQTVRDDLPYTREEALLILAEWAPSSCGPFLSQLESGAPPRCPACGSLHGTWVTWQQWMGDGVRQSDEDHRRRTEALLEPGAAAAEEAGVRKARDTQVWLCGAGLSEEERRSRGCCGRWTYEPVIRAEEGNPPLAPDTILAHETHHGGIEADRRMVDLMHMVDSVGRSRR